MKTRHTFLVTLSADSTPSEARAYVREAVLSMGGCHDPATSPFFGLGSRDVVVKPIHFKSVAARRYLAKKRRK